MVRDRARARRTWRRVERVRAGGRGSSSRSKWRGRAGEAGLPFRVPWCGRAGEVREERATKEVGTSADWINLDRFPGFRSLAESQLARENRVLQSAPSAARAQHHASDNPAVLLSIVLDKHPSITSVSPEYDPGIN
jgi:hypothetical protein